jgi:6-phosphogluconolactonase (cycloisomerase 2 family)
MGLVRVRSANRSTFLTALLASGCLLASACGGDGGTTGTGGSGGATGTAGSSGGNGGGGGGATGTGGSIGGSGGGGGPGGSGGTGGAAGSTGGSGVGGTGGAAGRGGMGGSGGGGAGGSTGGAAGRGGAGGAAGTGGAAGIGGVAGTGGSAGSGGYTMNGSTGALAPLATFVAGGAISNCEFNDAEDRMYVAHVIAGEGKITTYTRNVASGALTPLGTPADVPYAPPQNGGNAGGSGAGGTGGTAVMNANTQTLTFDRTGHFLAAPNYASGYVYIYSLATDGSVASLVSSDSGGMNAHNAVFTLNNQFMFVPYLGSNTIRIYGFNATTGAIISVANSGTPPNPMSGPRHLALHPNGMWLYSINETAGGASTTSGTIDQFSVNQTTGVLTSVATFNVPLPTGYSGLKNGSEIDIGPNGDLMFISMRLDNAANGSLVSYMINPTTGALTVIEQEDSHGITPRQFSLSKDRRFLVVGNQNSNTIAVFRVDPATGNMTFVADRDVCLSPRFARMAIDQ